MPEKHLEPFNFEITYVHDDGCHVIGLRKLDKTVVFVNVAAANKSCIGKRVYVVSSRIVGESECPAKFYKPYGISDPYEYGWKFHKLVTGSVVFGDPPPFREIPLSKAEKRQSTLDAMKKGTTWTNGKVTWVIRDECEERLDGNVKKRIWVSTPEGRRGQALYAESLLQGYYRI
jgi:hypothetical protein